MTADTHTAPEAAEQEPVDDARTVVGGDWDDFVEQAAGEEHVVVNMGPQHPSTHGVIRLVLELDGETVQSARLVIGYLHTGIEKNLEYRNWVQGVSYVTRMDYLSPTFNETAYCLAVEKLLGIEAPPRAQALRVLCMELNRMTSHLFGFAATALELASFTGTTNALREREMALDLLELITGLRMNHAYVRPGGVAQDLPPGAVERGTEMVRVLRERFLQMDDLLTRNTIWRSRLQGIAVLDVQQCLALGVTGPVLRSAGLAWDLRKTDPYCGYQDYDFDVPTATAGDAYSRFLLRKQELHESLRIIEQVLDRLEPGPVMVEDKKIAWPAQLSLGSDGSGQSLEHVRHIMSGSMEALIHHFKLVTEGFRVPAGQVYAAIESPRGELGVHAVSEGGTRPFRLHVRDPSFANLQALPAMCEGGMLSDMIAAIASIDPVSGGVDR